MTTAQSPRASSLDYVAVLARWVLGGLFIYMGLKKALDPVAFLKLVHQYDILPSPLPLNFVVTTLPWFEVFCGLLLVAGIAVRGAALMLVLMLVPFTALVLRRALAIMAAQHLPFTAIKFDCGCGNGEVFIWKKLIENSLMILGACWLLYGAGRRLALRFSLFAAKPRDRTVSAALPQAQPSASASTAR